MKLIEKKIGGGDIFSMWDLNSILWTNTAPVYSTLLMWVRIYGLNAFLILPNGHCAASYMLNTEKSMVRCNVDAMPTLLRLLHKGPLMHWSLCIIFLLSTPTHTAAYCWVQYFFSFFKSPFWGKVEERNQQLLIGVTPLRCNARLMLFLLLRQLLCTCYWRYVAHPYTL